MEFLSKLREKLPFVVGGPKEHKSNVLGEFFKGLKSKLPFIGDRKKEVAPEPEFTPVIASAINTQEAPIIDSYLEAPPEIDQSLLEIIEPPKSVLLYVLKGFFSILVSAGLAILLFFTSQLTHVFDFTASVYEVPSAVKTLETGNAEIQKLQTDINMYRFLQGKLYLDQFTYDGDEFVKNYRIASNKTAVQENRDAAQKNLDELRVKLTKSLTLAQDKLLQPIETSLIGEEYTTDFDFRFLFSSLLNQKLADTSSSIATSTSKDDKLEYKLYKRTQALINNIALFNNVRGKDLTKMNDLEVVNFIMDLNDTIVNELSAIQAIKDERINWSDVINRIELETSRVDKYFSKDYFNEIGGIQYTSFDFDTNTGKITIAGTTKRFDTNNFTMISNLIDQLNDSPYFKSVEMKSFTKTGSVEEGYTAVLRLNLELQKEAVRKKEGSATDQNLEFKNNN